MKRSLANCSMKSAITDMPPEIAELFIMLIDAGFVDQSALEEASALWGDVIRSGDLPDSE